MTNKDLIEFLDKHISIDMYPEIIMSGNCLKFDYSNKTAEVILNNEQVILVKYFIDQIKYMQDIIYDLKSNNEIYNNN